MGGKNDISMILHLLSKLLCSLAKILDLLAKPFAFSHKCIATFHLLTEALKYSFLSHLILIPLQKLCKQESFLVEHKGFVSGCKRTEI